MRKQVIYLSLILLLLIQGFEGKAGKDGTNPGSLVTQNIIETNTLLNAYTKPLLLGFGNNLGLGWYSTGAPLKPFRFEFKVVSSASLIPSKDQTFDLSALNLSSYKPASGSGNIFPTILGKKADSARMNILVGAAGAGQLSKSIMVKALPLPVSAMPYATPQLSLGLFKGTELMLRFTPPISVSVGNKGQTFKLNVFGIGVKHDIGQWIPVVKSLPFSLSAYVAYTKLSAELGGAAFYESADLVDDYGFTTYTSDPNPPDYSNQTLKLDAHNWVVGGIISKKASFLTIFGGLSLSGFSTSFKLNGGYPVLASTSTYSNPVITHVTDPVSLQSSRTQVSLNGGIRIKILILNVGFSGNYVPGGYSSAVVSVGFGYFN